MPVRTFQGFFFYTHELCQLDQSAEIFFHLVVNQPWVYAKYHLNLFFFSFLFASEKSAS